MRPIDFNIGETNTMEVNGYNQLVAIILPNIVFCVRQKKDIHNSFGAT